MSLTISSTSSTLDSSLGCFEYHDVSVQFSSDRSLLFNPSFLSSFAYTMLFFGMFCYIKLSNDGAVFENEISKHYFIILGIRED